MTDLFYIIVLNDGKVSVAEINWYEDIESYYWLCSEKFKTRQEAIEAASIIVGSVRPLRRESDELYMHRCRKYTESQAFAFHHLISEGC